MGRLMMLTACFCLAAATAAAAAASAALPLTGGGEPLAAVILPAEPAAEETRAAAELVEHVRLISGVTLPVISGGPAPAGLLPVRLGTAAPEQLADRAREQKDNPSSFALVADSAGIGIRGVSPEGTLFGVYELLEQQGVRWYMPGDVGRVLPPPGEVTVASQETVQGPSMDFRRLGGWITTTPWFYRQRLGGEAGSTGSHGIRPFARNQRLFESNPEYFALIGGERRLRQVCVSNPGAVAQTVDWFRGRHEPTDEKIHLGMGPNDGEGYCECADCRALDGDVLDPIYGITSVSGRYIWFFNQVLAALEGDFPNLHIAWYVYARHMMPPPPGLEPNPRIVHVFAPISQDRIRGMDNPMSPDRHLLRWLIDRWSEYEPNKMYYRGYYNNLACPQFPLGQVDRVRHEIPALYERGIKGMRVEVIRQGWVNHAVTLHLAARLMWDVETDVEALLAEFAEKFYGPAAGPMGRYWEAIDAAFRDTPYFTGSSYVYFPIFDTARRNALRRLLDEAARRTRRATGREPYAERVRIARLGFDRLELFLEMIAARNRHDYGRAYRLKAEFNRFTDELVAHVLEGDDLRDQRRRAGLINYMERTENRGSYFNRFFAQPISSAYRRTVADGDLVAGLPDEWDFLLDPSGIGELGGWQRPGPLGGNWQRLKTTSRTWSDQGLHYYKGLAWYRTEVEMPERFRGRRVYLWLGGVDNLATIWVNGRYLGTSREPGEGLPGVPGSFRPFDVEATAALRFGPGATNTVTIRVLNDRLAELGTGGITGPVMFWSPRDADWRP